MTVKRYRLAMDSTTHRVHLDEDPEGRYCEYADAQKLQSEYLQLMDHAMTLKADVERVVGAHTALLKDHVEARAALKVAHQSLIEFRHAQECGPSWYTRGERGMYQQVALWLRRGMEAVQSALGPSDDNGEYEKEKTK